MCCIQNHAGFPPHARRLIATTIDTIIESHSTSFLRNCIFFNWIVQYRSVSFTMQSITLQRLGTRLYTIFTFRQTIYGNQTSITLIHYTRSASICADSLQLHFLRIGTTAQLPRSISCFAYAHLHMCIVSAPALIRSRHVIELSLFPVACVRVEMVDTWNAHGLVMDEHFAQQTFQLQNNPTYTTKPRWWLCWDMLLLCEKQP